VEVPILKQGDVLIATVQAALTDADLLHLRTSLIQQSGALPVTGRDRGRDFAGRDGFVCLAYSA
jgi:hypothetical protein